MSSYIHLTSNDSLAYYPLNKVSNFRVKLSKRLDLSQNWEVACVRFSFTHSLCTFNSPQSIYYVDYKTKEKMVGVLIAPQRLRDVNHLIELIHRVMVNEVNLSLRDYRPKLGILDGRVVSSTGFINGKMVELGFSEGLSLLLGLEREGFHYMDAFKTDLYVYADCVTQRVVGDVYAPLLTTIDIGNLMMTPGEQVIVKIKKPVYVPISHSQVDEIEIQLLDDSGREPVFEFGTVSLTLHFRER